MHISGVKRVESMRAAEKLGYSELHQKQEGEVRSFLNGTELFEQYGVFLTVRSFSELLER